MIKKSNYTNVEWLVAKRVFALGMFPFLVFVLYKFNGTEILNGICYLFNCNYIANSIIKILIALVAFVAFIGYFFEKKMLASLFTLSLVSIGVFSASSSSGIFNQTSTLSMILVAQFIAYAKFKLLGGKQKLYNDRFNFSIQIISASYVLSAISKLTKSGWDWVFSYEEFVLQVNSNLIIYELNWGVSLKEYIDFLNVSLLSNEILVWILLMLSLLIELFAFVMIFSKKSALAYSMLLLLFHLGILMLMGILIPPIVLAVVVFSANLPYMIYNKRINSG